MERSLSDQLEQMLIEQVQCQNEQDLPGVLRLIHKESFSYNPTQQLLMRLFATYQLRFELLEKKFLAVDGDYAFVRLQLKSEKVEGPEFKNNVTDSIVVFRNMGEGWKIWCQSPISFQEV